MNKTNFKALSTVALMITLSACSSAQKSDTGAYDRTPAQAGGVQQLVKVFTTTSGLTAEQVEQKLITNLIAGKVVPAGTTFTSLANNPALSEKVTAALIKAIKNKGKITKTFGITDANSSTALKQLDEAKNIFAASAKIKGAEGKGDMKSEGAVSFFGADAVATFNALPESIKPNVLEHMTRAMEVAKDMPAKKGTLTKIVMNGLEIAKRTKHNYFGRWVCVNYGDLRQELALDNLEIISAGVLADINGGLNIEKRSDFRQYTKRHLASVTKLTTETVEENTEVLHDEKACDIFAQ